MWRICVYMSMLLSDMNCNFNSCCSTWPRSKSTLQINDGTQPIKPSLIVHRTCLRYAAFWQVKNRNRNSNQISSDEGANNMVPSIEAELVLGKPMSMSGFGGAFDAKKAVFYVPAKKSGRLIPVAVEGGWGEQIKETWKLAQKENMVLWITVECEIQENSNLSKQLGSTYLYLSFFQVLKVEGKKHLKDGELTPPTNKDELVPLLEFEKKPRPTPPPLPIPHR
jgi:hypothetical protein